MTIKPGTPLPWELGPCQEGGGALLRIGCKQYRLQIVPTEDAAYIVSACNAYPRLVEALTAIAGVLEAPRDRLGRLDIAATQGEAREALRLLAVKWNATGGTDYMHQCSNVARALLRELGDAT